MQAGQELRSSHGTDSNGGTLLGLMPYRREPQLLVLAEKPVCRTLAYRTVSLSTVRS
jgi:hypothetical protein